MVTWHVKWPKIETEGNWYPIKVQSILCWVSWPIKAYFWIMIFFGFSLLIFNALRKSVLILFCFSVYSSNKQEVLTFRLPQHVSNCIATAIFSYFLVHWKFMRHCSCALFCPSLSYFVWMCDPISDDGDYWVLHHHHCQESRRGT